MRIMALQNAWQNTKERARETWAQLTWSEVSGSLGDLGTFLPLLVSFWVSSWPAGPNRCQARDVPVRPAGT